MFCTAICTSNLYCTLFNFPYFRLLHACFMQRNPKSATLLSPPPLPPPPSFPTLPIFPLPSTTDERRRRERGAKRLSPLNFLCSKPPPPLSPFSTSSIFTPKFIRPPPFVLSSSLPPYLDIFPSSFSFPYYSELLPNQVFFSTRNVKLHFLCKIFFQISIGLYLKFEYDHLIIRN